MEKRIGRALRIPVRASLIFTIGNVFCRGIAVLATPLFTRILTAEEYGVYTLYLTWLTLFTSLATLEVGGSVLFRGIQKHEGHEDGFLCSALLFALAPFLVTFALSMLWREQLSRLSGLSPWILLLLFIQILANLLLALFGAKCHYFYRPMPHFLITGASALLSPLLSLLFIYFTPYRAEARIYSGVILAVLSAIPAAFFLFRTQRKKDRVRVKKRRWIAGHRTQAIDRSSGDYEDRLTEGTSADAALTKAVGDIRQNERKPANRAGASSTKTRRFSLLEGLKFLARVQLPLLPHYFSLTFISGSSRILLSRMSDTTALAKFSVASAPGLSLLLITGGINSALQPWIYRKLEEGRTKDIRRITEPVLMLVGGVSVLLVLICPEILRILAPQSYADALIAVIPIALSIYPMFLYTLFGSVELHAERVIRCSITSVISAALSFALAAYLTSRFGIVGAAFSYLCSYILLALFHYRAMRKILSEPIINVNNSLLIYAICLFVSSLSLLFADRLFIRLSIGAAICIYLLLSLRSFKKLLTE